MWISISDALPSNIEDVLVSDGEDYSVGWYDSNTEKWYPSASMLTAENKYGSAVIEFYFDVKWWKDIERIGK